MNTQTSKKELAHASVIAPESTSDASALMNLIQRAAMDAQFDVGKLQALMEMKERWDATEARKAYMVAFSAFKAEGVRLVKGTEVLNGPLKGQRYANLGNVVQDVTGALSRHGLSAACKLTKDDKDWIEITCTLTHIAGHQESVSMGGAPDVGPGRNAIQARASAVSYLERYTLKAITGLAEQADDDDAQGAGASEVDAKVADWLATFDAIAKPQTEADCIEAKGQLVAAYGGMPEKVPAALIQAYKAAIKRVRETQP